MISSVLWFLNDMLSLKTDFNVPLVTNKQKTLEKIGILKVTAKKRRLRIRNTVYGFKGSNPYQNVTDSEYCFKETWLLLLNTSRSISEKNHIFMTCVFSEDEQSRVHAHSLFPVSWRRASYNPGIGIL